MNNNGSNIFSTVFLLVIVVALTGFLLANTFQLVQDLDTERQKTTELTDQNGALASEISGLRETNRRQAAVAQDLSNQIKQTSGKIQAAEQQLLSSQQNLQGAQAQVDALNQQIKQLEQDKRTLESAANALRAQLQALKNENKSLLEQQSVGPIPISGQDNSQPTSSGRPVNELSGGYLWLIASAGMTVAGIVYIVPRRKVFKMKVTAEEKDLIIQHRRKTAK